MVAYTGVDTKLVLNQGEYQHKISTLQYGFNVVMTVHFLIFVIAICLSSFLGNRVGTYSLKDHSYLFSDKSDFEGIIW